MSDSPVHRTVSDAELDALKVLWRAGPQTAGEVREKLNADGRSWAYTTTKTILDRLEEKGYVRRDRGSIPHVYIPVVSANAIGRERFGEVRREIFDGAGLPLIRALVEGSRLTREEVSELRRLLDTLSSDEEEQ